MVTIAGPAPAMGVAEVDVDARLQDTPATAKRRHLPAAERERLILEAATRFFAERGFEGQTRELAKRMGITHSAIFRYFPTKEALIDRVYEQVYVQRWNPAWAGLIQDRSMSLETRLIRFYREYADRIFDYEWVRIFIYSGLRAYDITPRYLAIIEDKLIRPVCAELRAELGLPSPAEVAVTEREREAVWALHGQVFYIAIRKFVYGRPIPQDYVTTIDDDVRVFLRGVPDLVREVCAAARDARPQPTARTGDATRRARSTARTI